MTLNGDDNESKRRRNALTNALTSLAPKLATGNKTIQAVVRILMYAIAPPRLWQFFSSQGKSGSMRCSLVVDMPNIYKVIMTAAAIQSGLNKDTIVSAISDVVRSCQTRAESKAYCRDHPELLPRPAKVIAIQPQAAGPELTSSVDTDNSPRSSPASSPRSLPPWSANASATNSFYYNHSSGESVYRDETESEDMSC